MQTKDCILELAPKSERLNSRAPSTCHLVLGIFLPLNPIETSPALTTLGQTLS